MNGISRDKICDKCKNDLWYRCHRGFYCAICKATKTKEWIEKNPTYTRKQKVKTNLRRKQLHRACFFCGYNDIRGLEYHHIKPRGHKTRIYMSEILDGSTVSLCGSCHNILHYESRKRHNAV